MSRMRAGIVLGIAASLIGAYAAEVRSENPREPAVRQVAVDAGKVHVTLGDGTRHELAEPDGARVVTPEVRLQSAAKEPFVVEESIHSGAAITTVTNGKTCMVIERPIGEAAPTVQFEIDGRGNPGAIVTWASGCGGCMIAGRSEPDLEVMACVPGCDDCTCQWCTTVPCPPPGGYVNCEENPEHPTCSAVDLEQMWS